MEPTSRWKTVTAKAPFRWLWITKSDFCFLEALKMRWIDGMKQNSNNTGHQLPLLRLTSAQMSQLVTSKVYQSISAVIFRSKHKSGNLIAEIAWNYNATKALLHGSLFRYWLPAIIQLIQGAQSLNSTLETIQVCQYYLNWKRFFL